MMTSGLLAIALSATLLGPQPGPVSTPRQVAAGVYVLDSSAKYGSANLGFVVLSDRVVLVGLPHPDLVARALAASAGVTDRPVRLAVATHARAGEKAAAKVLSDRGIEVLAPAGLAARLREGSPATARVREFSGRAEVGDGSQPVDALELGPAAGPADAAVYLPKARVLFAGEVCINGPRAELAGSDVPRWVGALRRLEALPSRTVVPGFGTTAGPEALTRQRRFLVELRRQVAHLVAQGRPLDNVVAEVRLGPEWLRWMPYDHPTRPDVEHVYRALTVPIAPYGGRPPESPASNSKPRALALVGDRPHDPGHIEEGLRRALESAGVDPVFTFDVRALSAENLKPIKLLAILRDGFLWPGGAEGSGVSWMTPAQEKAVVDFVEAGGGLLALHNCMGLYPDDGPYLHLVGGRYTGHGPLERFAVKVVDREHPVTRGVTDYVVADEQHTPIPDAGKVHLLLESRSDEGVIAPSGWVRQAGRGRVCHLANGHTKEAQAHPEFQKLVRNGARWCLGLGD
jgi:type 1 glutamine amidotransferase